MLMKRLRRASPGCGEGGGSVLLKLAELYELFVP
jgi:hypothetical protein